jgi:carbamoyl-phosphate synthase large subunit
MRSTGEVLGLADSFPLAFWKAQEAVTRLPSVGTVLFTVAERDRNGTIVEAARRFAELGFRVRATAGTRAFLVEHGIPAELVLKQHEGRPHIVDEIVNRKINLVINTPAGKESEHDDSYIRKAAIRHKVPYITTMTAALAAANGIAAYRDCAADVKSLQAYHAQIGE